MSLAHKVQRLEEERVELLNALDALVEWTLANRGTKDVFVKCRTLNGSGPKAMPDVIKRAEWILKRVRRK